MLIFKSKLKYFLEILSTIILIFSAITFISELYSEFIVKTKIQKENLMDSNLLKFKRYISKVKKQREILNDFFDLLEKIDSKNIVIIKDLVLNGISLEATLLIDYKNDQVITTPFEIFEVTQLDLGYKKLKILKVKSDENLH